MKRLSPALPLGLLILCNCAPDLPPTEVEAAGQPVPFEPVASVILNGPDTPSYRLILDEEAWAAAWSELISGHAPPQPAPPSIDFESRIVVFAAAGQLPTQLRSFGIEDVRLKDGMLHVIVREDWPASPCGSLPVVTRPADIVSVPRLATSAEFVQRRTSGC